MIFIKSYCYVIRDVNNFFINMIYVMVFFYFLLLNVCDNFFINIMFFCFFVSDYIFRS